MLIPVDAVKTALSAPFSPDALLYATTFISYYVPGVSASMVYSFLYLTCKTQSNYQKKNAQICETKSYVFAEKLIWSHMLLPESQQTEKSEGI